MKAVSRKRTLEKKTKEARIYQIFVWNKKFQRHTRPPNPFRAYRYERQIDGKHKRVFRCFRNLTDAKLWKDFKFVEIIENRTPTSREREVKWIKVQNNVIPHVVDKQRYTFFSLYQDFKEKRLSLLSKGTQEYYEKKLYLLNFFFDLEVKIITPETIDQWIMQLKRTHQKEKFKTNRSDFEKEIKMLKTIFNWHIQYNRVSKWLNPIRIEHAKMSQIRPKQVKLRKYMTKEEKNLWYESLKKHSPDFYVPAFVQTEQVMRVGETFAMTWKNLDLNNKTYLLTHHIRWPREKRSTPEFIQGTKTQKQSFLMPLRKPVIDLLKKLEEEKSSPYIFHKYDRPFLYKEIQNGYNKAFKKAKLPFSGTHVCRHTGATLFLEKTGDPLALQEIGNWKTQSQTLEYGRILKQRLRRAIDKMDREDFEYEN